MSNLLTSEVSSALTCNKSKLLMITVGNSMRSDDGVGCYIAQNFQNIKLPANMFLIDAQDQPENIIDQAVNIKPNKTVIIDAADFQGIPGEARIIEKKNIPDNTLTTHRFPLNIIAEILEKDTGSNVLFLGIQPKTVEFGEKLSLEVKNTADEIINYVLRNTRKS